MDMIKKISSLGIVPVIKLTDAANAVPLCRALANGGLPVAEITFRTAAAEESIRRVAQELPEVLVGAGTVLTTEHIDKAIAAGASFIVTPGLDPELVVYAQEKNIPIYPGCTTPTDYHTAYKLGLEVLKFFPAEQSGGLAKIKAMAAPFPMFKVMPTGGISLKNLGEYLSSKVICACGGSYMVTAELIEGGKWDEITDLCKKSVEIVKEARSNG
jgi:Entner-Doudoroff aldolase